MRITYPYPRHLSACVLADLSPCAQPRFASAPPPRAVAFPVLRWLKAHAIHKHTEVLSVFWDRVAPLYGFFGNAFNRADYDGTGEASHATTAASNVRAAPARLAPPSFRSARTSDSVRRPHANARENKKRV